MSTATCEPAMPVNQPAFHLTDTGNADRIRVQHNNSIRYYQPKKTWLGWDGKRWSVDSIARVEQLVKSTVLTIYQEAAQEKEDAKRAAIAKHAAASEAAHRRAAMLKLAQSELPITPDELDRDPWLLNVANGTIDLRTGVLRAHRREDFITKLCPVEFDPGRCVLRGCDFRTRFSLSGLS